MTYPPEGPHATCPLMGACRGGAESRARATRAAIDPWDEVARQQEVFETAMGVIEAARATLLELAAGSAGHSRHVVCDQEDWRAIIEDCLDDMAGDTFACLPEAIARAKRELGLVGPGAER
jgi:hypothetical protein